MFNNKKLPKGFITLAFGKRYRKLAKNLLISYKFGKNSLPFCVITDKNDCHLKGFDIIKVVTPPDKGYFNKIYLDTFSPFNETIFIDAYCLIFDNIFKRTQK